MPIQIVPLLSALSEVAGTAWDLYRRTTRAKSEQHGQVTLAKRVAELESSQMEQARLLGELSKDLARFAESLKQEIDKLQTERARWRALAYLSLLLSVGALSLSLIRL